MGIISYASEGYVIPAQQKHKKRKVVGNTQTEWEQEVRREARQGKRRKVHEGRLHGGTWPESKTLCTHAREKRSGMYLSRHRRVAEVHA
jgi:hypothetical protein